MLSHQLEQTLHRALTIAREKRHEYATLEHLLLALIHDEDARQVMQSCGIDFDRLTRDLTTFLADPQLQHSIVANPGQDAKPTSGFQRVLQRSAVHVQSAGKEEVSGANVLIAMFSERESHAVYFLQKQDMMRLDAVNYISHGLVKSPAHHNNDVHGESTQQGGGTRQDLKALNKYTVNLNEKARNGHIDPLVGRSNEIERVVQVLCRRTKNNPLLVGDPGVGKTAIAEGLAQRIEDGQVPDILLGRQVYSLDMWSVLAGTRYRGDFEERLRSIVNELNHCDDAILFIDEIHSIVGAGATGGGANDASNLLKPVFSSGVLRCMGSTTYKDYRAYFEKDRALARRFQKIEIDEPTVEETIKILKGLRDRYEKHHKIRFTDASLKAATELAQRHITDRKLPDKAIDVLDEVGAAQALLKPNKRRKQVSVSDVEDTVARIARIPSRRVSTNERNAIANLDRDLKAMIYGQDEAIAQLDSVVKLSRSGLRNPGKPVGCFLFAGPTGVGKTELAKQLAAVMGMPLKRFDMSEYMERHVVSRLIGAPPGYVGFDQGGLLTDSVDQTPYCVVLLDEIEKAHPDVFNILLQVMDYGRLTDNNGKQVDFRHAVIIMTTNAGQHELSRQTPGFGRSSSDRDTSKEIRRLFSMEFRNRLDAVIHFASLTPDVSERVADKLVAELEALVSDKGISLSLTDAARAFLAREGYSEEFGARPMERLVQEKIKKPLSEEVLFGDLQNGGAVVVDVVSAKKRTKASASQDEGGDRIVLRVINNDGRSRPASRRKIPNEEAV